MIPPHPAPDGAHCFRCGGPLAPTRPDAHEPTRLSCARCGFIHYENPKVVVGTLVHQDGHILLCRRAIAPREGLWTLPAGFLECGESATEGALRETLEEAGAHARIDAPLVHLDLPHIGQLYLLFRATLVSPEVAPGPESLEARFFAPDALPWDALAFDTVRVALERWRADRADGVARLHYGTLRPRPEAPPPAWVPCVLEDAWSCPLGVAP